MNYLKLYFVTDEDLCAQAGRSVVDTVIAAVDGGATCVQLRAKTAEAGPFLRQTLEVCEAVGHRVPVIINDRVDVFLAARELGANVAGVHVGQEDLPAGVVRELIGSYAILGVSAATHEELAAAEQAGGVTYVGTGVLRGTATKPDAPDPLGVDGLSQRAEFSQLPMVAIGGIGLADMADLGATELAGAAVVSAICLAEDPKAMCEQLSAAWDEGRARVGGCARDGECECGAGGSCCSGGGQ